MTVGTGFACMTPYAAQIDEETTVDEVMRRWPATIRVFLDFRMSCVGCPIGTFHTVADACREHGTAAAVFLAALRVAAAPAGHPSERVPSAMPNSRCGSRRMMR